MRRTQMKTRLKRAQSILEYLIALTAIIAGFIAASGYLKSRIGGGVNVASNSIYNSLSGKSSLGGNASTGPVTNVVEVWIPLSCSLTSTVAQLNNCDHADILIGGSSTYDPPHPHPIKIIGVANATQQGIIAANIQMSCP
jgi:hypothetical protein